MDGQPAFGMGRMRAAASIVEMLVECPSGDGAGLVHVVFEAQWSGGLLTIARPMTPPIVPAITAMSIP